MRKRLWKIALTIGMTLIVIDVSAYFFGTAVTNIAIEKTFGPRECFVTAPVRQRIAKEKIDPVKIGSKIVKIGSPY